MVACGPGPRVISAAHVLVRLLAGGLVVAGVALGIQRGGSHVVHTAGLVRVDGHVSGRSNAAAGRDGRAGFTGQHRYGGAAGNAHIPGAGAGNRLGIDHMTGGLFRFGLQHQVEVVAQGADDLVGQGNRRLLGGVLQPVRDDVLEVDLGNEGEHFLVIEYVLLEGVRHVLTRLGEEAVHRHLLVGVLHLGHLADRGFHAFDILLEIGIVFDGLFQCGMEHIGHKSFGFLLDRFGDDIFCLFECLPCLFLALSGENTGDQFIHVVHQVLDHAVLHAGQDG